jgi:hypothetical protein
MAHMEKTHAPSPEQIAAALAAVQMLLDDEQPEPTAEPPVRPWQVAAKLEAQQQPPTRNAAHRTWGSVERARRANRWSFGITGL